LPLTIVDELADDFLAQSISQVPGVARVSIGGDRKPSIRIQVDPAKLAASGLTLEEVRAIIVSSTTNAAKGTIKTATTGFTIAANDQISEAQLFDDVVLAYRNGAPIRIRDVGHAIAEASNMDVAAYRTTNPAFC
jgi:HAE1 family hydrophobic/amphiphilic exporter-1